MANKKDLEALKKRAESAGWSVTPTRGGHYRWISPTGGLPYFSSRTPSDRRAVTNIEKDLRKRGLVLG